jgi:LDH2 family malate/lactate/ureidoglycolate dehydrogenase
LNATGNQNAQVAEPTDVTPGVPWVTMESWSVRLLAATGLEMAAAERVAKTLVYAERRGFTSHGFIRLPTYVERIQSGGINRHAKITFVRDDPAYATVDADAAIGAHSATTCVDLAIDKAKTAGIAIVLSRNANHFGAAGYYTGRMAEAGFLGIAVCNTDAVMCAPFGGRAVLGTNPISIGAPGSSGLGPQLDMATSEASHGKILVARDKGLSIPLGWGVDAEGAPTTDPNAVLAGALLPSGGPKGFGLAFMIDCLVAIGGASTSHRVSALYGDPAAPQELGHAFIAIAVDRAQTKAEYKARIADLTQAVHTSYLPNSSREPLVPGEPERQRLGDALDWKPEGTIVRQFATLSEALSVPIPVGLAID